MAIELKLHYVAFLDVLGFAKMVEDDIAGDDHPYLVKLFKCHQSAAQIFSDDPNCTLTQFSDSIVISKPFDPKGFVWFATRVARYQRLLLDDELLCRGGMAVNKHFSNGSFTFSAGVIDAYRVESNTARYPRVVISPDVIDLLYPHRSKIPAVLAEEDDGLLFIDYLGVTKRLRPVRLGTSIQNLVGRLCASKTASIREKGLWLAAYSDAALGTSLRPKKFVWRRIRSSV
jgi:hypothetical protein